MTDYPNILRVAQCSSPQLPNFGEAFFDSFESNVLAAVGTTAFLDSPFKMLVEPDWSYGGRGYKIDPKASWKQACFQVATSYLVKHLLPTIVFLPADPHDHTAPANYFIAAVLIELLQEWAILTMEDPFFDDFGTWLSEAHRIVCPECGEGYEPESEGLDRTDPAWVMCNTCDWSDTVSSLESTLTLTKPSNTFQQHAIKAIHSLTNEQFCRQMFNSIGDAFLKTCLDLGLSERKLSETLINKRHLMRY